MKNKLKIFCWIGWGFFLLLVGFFVIGGVIYNKSFQDGKIWLKNGVSVSWNPFSNNFKLSRNNQLAAKLKIPHRPLALWHREKTGSLAIVASENGSKFDNHILYLWKDGILRKLYHATSGYDQDSKLWLKSHLYYLNASDPAENSIYLAPNEELLLARETTGYGYYPRVFQVGRNGLKIQWLTWNFKDTYWSPAGRCVVVMGNEAEDGWGYFQKLDDFVYYTNYIINAVNRHNIKVVWKSETPCEGYLSFHGDYYGAMGSGDELDTDFYYVIGEGKGDEHQVGVKRINSLPTDYESFQPSLVDDWQLIMKTE